MPGMGIYETRPECTPISTFEEYHKALAQQFQYSLIWFEAGLAMDAELVGRTEEKLSRSQQID
jgi:hypothetical protein